MKRVFVWVFSCAVILFFSSPLIVLAHTTGNVQGAVPMHALRADIPAARFCYYTGCDGRYYNDGVDACNTDSWVYEMSPTGQNVYDAAGYGVGVVHMYISNQGSGACQSAWWGLRVNFGVNAYNSNGAIGNYSTKDVSGSTKPTQASNNWVSSKMDEVDNGCWSAWVAGNDTDGHTTTFYNTK